MVEYALQILFLLMTWLFKRFSASDADDDAKKAAITEKRDRAIGIYQKLSLREQNNAVEAVRRQVSLSAIRAELRLIKLHRPSYSTSTSMFCSRAAQKPRQPRHVLWEFQMRSSTV